LKVKTYNWIKLEQIDTIVNFFDGEVIDIIVFPCYKGIAPCGTYDLIIKYR